MKRSVADIERLVAEHEAKRARPMNVQLAEARAFIRDAVARHPQYLFLLENGFLTDPHGHDIVLMVEVLLRGALDERLDFHHMLHFLHPDPTMRVRARDTVEAMCGGKIPWSRDQMQ